MANVFNVAHYILEKTGPLSTMKLQKLCYYAQAWSLVWDDEPLFQEDFEAWRNGPVCKELFREHQGKFKISADEIPAERMNKIELTEEQRTTIDTVLDYYGDKSAQWLSQLSHMEEPWKQARKGIQPGAASTSIITKESMAEYYGSI